MAAMASGDMVDTDIGMGCVEVMLTTVATAAGDFLSKGPSAPFFIGPHSTAKQHSYPFDAVDRPRTMRGAGVEALILVPTPEINCYTKQLNELAAKAG